LLILISPEQLINLTHYPSLGGGALTMSAGIRWVFKV
jgi:hypothetical protein